MARMKLDPSGQQVPIDLHHYAVRTACDIAYQKVQEAWENGYDEITLIHGAPSSTHHFSAWSTGYGSIKWSLRRALANGCWMRWAYNRRSRQHMIEDGAMTLRLRPNPKPHTPPQWTSLPDPDY